MNNFDSEDDYRTGCRNVSHCQQQQSYSGLCSPGRSNLTYFWNDSWVQTFHNIIMITNLQTQGDKFIELLSMTRTSVLSSFSSNLPSISYFRKSRMHSSIARSATSCALSSSTLKLRYSCVLSAKQWTCGRWRSITLNSEEVSMTNSKGPRQEPWGTPQSKLCLYNRRARLPSSWLVAISESQPAFPYKPC